MDVDKHGRSSVETSELLHNLDKRHSVDGATVRKNLNLEKQLPH